jgi:hypothetical protein
VSGIEKLPTPYTPLAAVKEPVGVLVGDGVIQMIGVLVRDTEMG